MENNPYAAPGSFDSKLKNNKLFSRQGRIGRMRYFVYTQIVNLGATAVTVALGLLYGMAISFFELGELNDLMLVAMDGLINLVSVVIWVLFVVSRRCHDIGWKLSKIAIPALLFTIAMILFTAVDRNPLTTILMVVLGVWFLVLSLTLLFKRGQLTSNAFGSPPEPNSIWVKILFWVIMMLYVLAIITIFAAVIFLR